MNIRKRIIGLVAAVAVVTGFGLASVQLTASHPTTASAVQASVPLTTNHSTTAVKPQATATQHATLTSYATVCKTISVRNSFWWAPYTLQYGLYVPICYNGSQVWVNGGISPWIWSVGWSTNLTWYGSYNDGSHAWLGVGENISATFLRYTINFTLLPRWYINANGQVYAYVNS